MIQFNNVSFYYPNSSAAQSLRRINLTIERGEKIALMGPNGSGKTTLARCMNALLYPVKGQVLVDGLDTQQKENLYKIRRKVGMVFQNPDNQIVSATVEREVAFGLENLGLPVTHMHARVDEALEKFNLNKYRKQSPHHLSGGEKQRLALASVLAMRPDYLILDEPTSLLDPVSRRNILTTIRDISTSITIVLITQFPEESLWADRLLIMNRGKVVIDDHPHPVFERTDELLRIGLEPPVKYLMQKICKEHDIDIK